MTNIRRQSETVLLQHKRCLRIKCIPKRRSRCLAALVDKQAYKHYTYAHHTYIHTLFYIHTCTHIYSYYILKHTHVHRPTRTYCIHTRIRTCTYTHKDTHEYAITCIYIYTYIYIHRPTGKCTKHTYIHTYI